MAFNPFQPVNDHNASLDAEARAMSAMMGRGGFRSSILDLTAGDISQRAQQPFSSTSAIHVPNPADSGGTKTGEASVLIQVLEPGFMWLITRMFWDLDAGISPGGAPNQNNWVQGDGQLLFSLRVDFLHQPGYFDVPTRMGSLTQPEKIDRGIQVMPGQYVDIVVSVDFSNAAVPIILPGANIVAGIYGVKFPLH